MTSDLWTYRAAFLAPVDGDTVKLTVDHGMAIYSRQSIRLLDVNAPELGEGSGIFCREALVQWIFQHQHGVAWPLLLRTRRPLLLRTRKDTRSFNRYLGEIHCANCSSSLNATMRVVIADMPPDAAQ